MGRPRRYSAAAIIEGAKQVSAERGPHKLTIAAVAQRTGVPVGSIYHRYASRDEILAALWLDIVEEMQQHFLAALEGADAMGAGLAAVRWACDWVRRHPRESRLLLLHRRADFASDRWPASYRRRAQRLATLGGASLTAYAGRLGGGRSADVRTVRFALVDLPMAAFRGDIVAGMPPSDRMEQVVLQTCGYVLRQAARSQSNSRKRR
jgi:AcrR family transcriptional regulator